MVASAKPGIFFFKKRLADEGGIAYAGDDVTDHTLTANPTLDSAAPLFQPGAPYPKTVSEVPSGERPSRDVLSSQHDTAPALRPVELSASPWQVKIVTPAQASASATDGKQTAAATDTATESHSTAKTEETAKSADTSTQASRPTEERSAHPGDAAAGSAQSSVSSADKAKVAPEANQAAEGSDPATGAEETAAASTPATTPTEEANAGAAEPTSAPAQKASSSPDEAKAEKTAFAQATAATEEQHSAPRVDAAAESAQASATSADKAMVTPEANQAAEEGSTAGSQSAAGVRVTPSDVIWRLVVDENDGREYLRCGGVTSGGIGVERDEQGRPYTELINGATGERFRSYLTREEIEGPSWEGAQWRIMASTGFEGEGLEQPVVGSSSQLPDLPSSPPPVRSPGLPSSQAAYSQQAADFSAGDAAAGQDLSVMQAGSVDASVSISSANTSSITDTQYAQQSALHQIGRLGYGNSLASDAQGLERLWANGYTGQGVKVGVYDDGVETRHAELSGKSLTDSSVNNPYYAASSAVTSGNHGTAVAGIIAAKQDGQGTVGVAYDAQIGNYGILAENGTRFNEYAPDAYGKLSLYDVTNHSYAATYPGHLAPSAMLISGIESAEQTARGGLGGVHVVAAGNIAENANVSQLANSRYMVAVGALERSIQADRSDGETWRWSSGELLDINWRSVDNNATKYSAHGSNLLVSAIGGYMDARYLGVTQDYAVGSIDRTGTAGYFSGDTGGLDGTSAATPLVSGVAALMLQANPNLGWRDVQNILAYSSVGVGSIYGGSTKNEGSTDTTDASYAWKWNEGSEWNGGGLHFNEQYGYGMVNAYNAVRMAEVWTTVNGGKSLASVSSGNILNEVKVSGALAASAGIANVAKQEYSINVAGNVEVENAQLTLSLSHPNMSQLNVYLVSPSGTRLMVLDGTEWMQLSATSPVEHLGSFSSLTFGFQGFRGETAQGTWKLVVEDSNLSTTGTGTVVSANLDVYGASINVDNTYHYTDEFFTASSTQALQTAADMAARKTLSDTNGGIDWTDGAALINKTTLNLGAGQASTVYRNGVETSFISIAAGSLIENAITGDGDDKLTGNNAANKLYGMRGNDTLDGGLGADIMVGGEGNDIYYIDNVGDSVIELANGGIDEVRVNIQVQTWQPSNTIYSLGANIENATVLAPAEPPPIVVTATGATTVAGSLYGNGFDNALRGAAGISNYLYGGNGNDTIVGGDYQDILGGEAGDDYLDGGAGADSVVYYNARSAVNIDLSITGPQYTGGAGWDTLINIENIIGSSYSDRLTGNAANNRFQSFGGNDIIDGGTGIDLIEFTNALAAVNVNMNGWVVSSTNMARIGNCTINNCEGVSGSIYNDVFAGTSGNDYLNGYAGNDVVDGGAGDDILAGGSSADTLTGGAGKDIFVLATDRGLSINGSVDTITDFIVTDDVFRLISATFTAFVGQQGTLSASQFVSGEGQTTAKDADDYIIYNQTTGNVFYDADGSGTASAAILIADVTDGLNLTRDHFTVNNSLFP